MFDSGFVIFMEMLVVLGTLVYLYSKSLEDVFDHPEDSHSVHAKTTNVRVASKTKIKSDASSVRLSSEKDSSFTAAQRESLAEHSSTVSFQLNPHGMCVEESLEVQ